jgi:FkbH-like protein
LRKNKRNILKCVSLIIAFVFFCNDFLVADKVQTYLGIDGKEILQKVFRDAKLLETPLLLHSQLLSNNVRNLKGLLANIGSIRERIKREQKYCKDKYHEISLDDCFAMVFEDPVTKESVYYYFNNSGFFYRIIDADTLDRYREVKDSFYTAFLEKYADSNKEVIQLNGYKIEKFMVGADMLRIINICLEELYGYRLDNASGLVSEIESSVDEQAQDEKIKRPKQKLIFGKDIITKLKFKIIDAGEWQFQKWPMRIHVSAEFYFGSKKIGSCYIDIDSFAASIHTCHFDIDKDMSEFRIEMAGRMFLIADIVSKIFGLNTKYAHAYFTMSENEYTEHSHMPEMQRRKFWADQMLIYVPFEKLGLKREGLNGKRYLSGRYNDHTALLSTVVEKMEGDWKELFYGGIARAVYDSVEWERIKEEMSYELLDIDELLDSIISVVYKYFKAHRDNKKLTQKITSLVADACASLYITVYKKDKKELLEALAVIKEISELADSKLALPGKKALEIIKSMRVKEKADGKINLEDIREKGALIFDVDGTLLDNKRTLDSEPGMLNALLDLLAQGIRIAIISGNSRSETTRRVVDPVREGLQKRGMLDDAKNMVVYANGGATKITYDIVGNEVLDNKYNEGKGVDEEDIEIIKKVLQEALKDKLGLSAKEILEWQRWFLERSDFPNITFTLPWTKKEVKEIAVVPAENITAAMQGRNLAMKIASPWIEPRDGAQISIKLLPKLPREIRMEVIKRIEEELERQGRGGRLVLRTGGFASIDVNCGLVDKAVAVRDLINHFGFRDAECIYYFGDEFRENGNDMPVLQVSGIHVLSATRKEEDIDSKVRDKLQWIGAGPKAVKGFLQKRLEDIKIKEALSVLGLLAENDIETIIWGTDTEKSVFRTAIEEFMGVNDLVADQRIPEKKDEAEQRAKMALRQAAIKLADLGKKLDQITQAEFNFVLGTSQIILAGGLAQRYSPILHKSLGTMEEAGDTNMRLAIWGSYKSPETHPVISIGSRLIEWLLKDEILEELIASDLDAESFMIQLLRKNGLKPVVINGVIQRAIAIPDSIIDMEKKALFFASDAVVLYHHHFGHGDGFAESLRAMREMGTLGKTKFKQYVFGEMAEACLPEKSFSSFITYLEAVASDNLITMGSKEADPKTQAKGILTKKGNLFLEEGRLVAFTDAPDMPNYRKERLKRVLEKLAKWEELGADERMEIKNHFAVNERGEILISANCGIFRNDIIDYLDLFYVYDENGGKLGFKKIDITEDGTVVETYQIDPKTGIPAYVTPDLVEIVSRHWQEQGWAISDLSVGYVNAGKAPNSIKDIPLQVRFNGKLRDFVGDVLGQKAGIFLGASVHRKLSELVYRNGVFLFPEDGELFLRRKEILRKQLFYTAVFESKNYKAFLRIFKGNKNKLRKYIEDTAIDLGVNPAYVVLGRMGAESYLSLGLSEEKRKPLKLSPKVTTLTGGTAIPSFLLEALEEAGFTTDEESILMAGLIPTLDDGGSTYDIITDLNKSGFGVLPAIGDQAHVLLAGLASFDRVKYILGDYGRILDSIIAELSRRGMEVTLENAVSILLEKTYADEGIEREDDLLFFAGNILSACRIVDANYIKKGILKLKGASIRNMFIIAMLHEYGLLVPGKNEDDEAIDNAEKAKKYQDALDEIAHIAGVKDGIVAPISFEPATLYARYEDNVLIWSEVHAGREEKLYILIKKNNEGIRIKFRRYGEMTHVILVEGEEAEIDTDVNKITIRIQSGRIFLIVNGEEWILEEKENETRLVNGKDADDQYILANDGSGRGKRTNSAEFMPLNLGGLEMILRSRLIVMQTNITETVNFSKIIETGLLDSYSRGKPNRHKRLRANNKAVKCIFETKDMVIVGPGSIITSILPFFMIPEIVDALIKAKLDGKRVVWIMNATLDNETRRHVKSETVGDIIKMLEDISGKKLEDIFTDIIFTSYDNEKASTRLKKALFQKPVITVREPGAAARESKKSLGPLVPTEEEVEGIRKRGIFVHQDELLTVKEVIDRGTGKISYKIVQDPKKVGKILEKINSRVVLSHEIEEKWEVTYFNPEDKNLRATIRYFWKGNVIGELALDLDPTAASINTCFLRSYQTGQKLAEEMVARAYLGAYYISNYLGWETELAHAFFTLSLSEERESEYWSGDKWDWLMEKRPEVRIIRKLGLEKGEVLEKEHLSGVYGRYNDRTILLKKFRYNAGINWGKWFYEERLKKILGEDDLEETKLSIKDNVTQVMSNIMSNAKEVVTMLGSNSIIYLGLEEIDVKDICDSMFIRTVELTEKAGEIKGNRYAVYYENGDVSTEVLSALKNNSSLDEVLLLEINNKKGIIYDENTGNEHTMELWKEPRRMLRSFAFSCIKEAVSLLKIKEGVCIERVVNAVVSLITAMRNSGCDDTEIIAALPVMARELGDVDAFIDAIYIETILFKSLSDGKKIFLREEQCLDYTNITRLIPTVYRAVTKPVFSAYSQILKDKSKCVSFAKLLSDGLRKGIIQAEDLKSEEELEKYLKRAAEKFKILPVLKKCIVLDCDGVLWDGIVGEDGTDGIRITPLHVEFQKKIKELKEKGVLLAINSKNNLEDIEKVFRKNPAMVLEWEDFVVVKANWQDKADNIREIIEELHIGADSAVFIDDNPHETDQMRRLCPEVLTIDMPDVSSGIKALDACRFSEGSNTAEDRNRTETYRAERKRQRDRSKFSALEDYYRSLEMKAVIREGKENISNIPRIAQLTQRTNQFNLTTKRYSEREIEFFINSPDYKIFTLELSDKYGDYGVVGLIILHKESEKAWTVDTFCLSCRAIGLTIEQVLMAYVLNALNGEEIEVLKGVYISTERNEAARDVYAKLGFKKVSENSDKTIWELKLKDNHLKIQDWIEVVKQKARQDKYEGEYKNGIYRGKWKLCRAGGTEYLDYNLEIIDEQGRTKNIGFYINKSGVLLDLCDAKLERYDIDDDILLRSFIHAAEVAQLFGVYPKWAYAYYTLAMTEYPDETQDRMFERLGFRTGFNGVTDLDLLDLSEHYPRRFPGGVYGVFWSNIEGLRKKLDEEDNVFEARECIGDEERMVNKCIEKIVSKYGVGILAVIDKIKVAFNMPSGQNYIIVKEKEENILLLGAGLFVVKEHDKEDSGGLLYLVLEKGLIESIMSVIPYQDEDGFDAALRVFNELREARSAVERVSRTTRKASEFITVTKTFTGLRVNGLEKISKGLAEIVGVLVKQITNADNLSATLTKMDTTKYILADKKRLDELKGAMGDRDYELVASNLERNNFELVTEMPEGVALENVIRLVDPGDLEKMPNIDRMYYLPVPYTRSALYIAANIIQAEGDLNKIPLVKELIKNLYKKLSEDDLRLLITQPWTVMPKIKPIIQEINNIRKAVVEIEKAA